jgi:hypothetical protein
MSYLVYKLDDSLNREAITTVCSEDEADDLVDYYCNVFPYAYIDYIKLD